MRNITWDVIAIFVVLTIFCSQSIHADMGAIIPLGQVTVQEPGQKAIIFFNGVEEILILQTDLQTSQKTSLLRFIPFPSEPTVKLAPDDCFDKLGNLLVIHDVHYLLQVKGGDSQGEQPVEIQMHQKLGAHEVTVIKVNNAEYFRTWVEDFFKTKGNAIQQETYPAIEAIVTDYVNRGMQYFSFDFVELTEEITSVNPLAYQFKNDTLYYPLKTSNLFDGTGRIELFIFAKYAQRTLGMDYSLSSTSHNISREEVYQIYPDAVPLFHELPVIFQAFKYEGRLYFHHDVLCDYSDGLKELKPNHGDKK
jgi:hypothetical protein